MDQEDACCRYTARAGFRIDREVAEVRPEPSDLVVHDGVVANLSRLDCRDADGEAFRREFSCLGIERDFANDG